MIPNHSPWIKQLNRTRPAIPLSADLTTDIIVVGGGIAGIATSYYALRDTDKRIVLIEADKIAHGATGHNAGQLVAEFERSFSSLVRQYGMPMTVAGLNGIKSAWTLLEEIQQREQLKTPLWRTAGYGGLSDPAQVLDYLADSLLQIEAGLSAPRILIAAEWEPGLQIPVKYTGLYEWLPQTEVLALLETNDTRYIGAYEDRERGCMNSALFCEELLHVMLQTWPDRFVVAEMSPVEKIILHPERAEVQTGPHTVTGEKVVLCTNGFEHFTIEDEKGIDIDTKFHRSVRGTIGYMAAFIEPRDKPPITNWYQDQPGIDPEQPYFYVTRRPYDLEGTGGNHNLLGVGGPETELPEELPYDRQHPFHPDIHAQIDSFMRRTYKNYQPGRTEDAFFWHGLMGYTKNGTRLIGPEPCNPTLMYNLGCNGVGLLHSIYGGKRISEFLQGKQMDPSIFDPVDRRCIIAPPTR